MKAYKHLIETGFMGSGKSSVGKRAAAFFEIPFYDTDTWVETTSGMSIPVIFKTEGVLAFREREVAALQAILEREPGVVSTGGGIVSTELGREALKKCGAPVVWLDVPFAVAKARVEADKSNVRPLFDDPVAAELLYVERQEWYQETATARTDASGDLIAVAASVGSYVQIAA